MKKIIFKNQDGYDLITSWLKSYGSINMLGFSSREIRIYCINDKGTIAFVKSDLVEDFLLALCEASGVDFYYTVSESTYDECFNPKL